jgi:hypothetical protein
VRDKVDDTVRGNKAIRQLATKDEKSFAVVVIPIHEGELGDSRASTVAWRSL